MRINKIIFKIFLLVITILMCCSCYSFASGTGLPSLSDFEPQISMGSQSKSIISGILGALTVIGIIAIVLSIAIIGFNTILGSASEKAAGQEKYGGLVIAAVLITSGSIIARLIISLAENI